MAAPASHRLAQLTLCPLVRSRRVQAPVFNPRAGIRLHRSRSVGGPCSPPAPQIMIWVKRVDAIPRLCGVNRSQYRLCHMNSVDTSRPQLKIRGVHLDTGRENVVVISRQSKALRAEIFRGFSRVELRIASKVLLATLLITDDDTLVGPDEIGLSEPALRRFAEPAGNLVTVTPAVPPEEPRSGARQDPRPDPERRRNNRGRQRSHPLPLLRHGDRRLPDQFGQLHDQRRTARPHPGDGKCGNTAEMARSDRGRQALHRWHSGQSNLDDRGADRGGARAADPKDLVASHHLSRRHGRHDGSAGPGQCRRRGNEDHRCGLQWLPRARGRARQPVAGRRYIDLGRTPAQPRYPRADGRFDHVEEARGRVDPIF